MISLKSKAIEVYDYHKIDFLKYVEPFKFDEEIFQESLEFLKKKYVTLVDVTCVEKNDLVTIKCQSEIKKFNKESISLNVGKNLYSKELEKQIIGWKLNENKVIHVNQHPVNIEILRIQRNQLPELTDEFINKTFIDLSSYDDLVNWYVNDQKRQYLEIQVKQISEKICDEVIQKSTFEVNQEEVEQARLEGKKIVEDMWKFNGLPLDEMSNDQAIEILGYPSSQEYINWFMGVNEQSFYTSLLGIKYLNEVDGLPTIEQYEEILKQYSEEDNKSIDEMREIFTFTKYIKQTSAEQYQGLIENYVYQKLEEEIK